MSPQLAREVEALIADVDLPEEPTPENIPTGPKPVRRNAEGKPLTRVAEPHAPRLKTDERPWQELEGNMGPKALTPPGRRAR